MYPRKWKDFLEFFEHETSKPYGKVIIDLRPNTPEEYRLASDDTANNLIVKQNVRQQRNLQYSNPTLDQAQKTQENMDSILENPTLNDDQKTNRYGELMREYQMYMSKMQDTIPTPPIINQPPRLQRSIFQTPIFKTRLPSTSSTLETHLPTIFETPQVQSIPKPFFRETFPHTDR